MNILELRKKIDDIKYKYDEKIAQLQIEISKLEELKNEELGDLPALYDAECSNIIESYENGTYDKIKGVSIRELKTVSITDESLVPNKYKHMVVNDKLVKSEVKESGYTLNIPGVTVGTKYSVAVKLK